MSSFPIHNKSVGFPPVSQIGFRAPLESLEDENDNGSCQWYSPSEDSLPVNFCSDTSLHGLQYLGQPKRHLFERIFWLIAVAAAIGTAGYLIHGMYTHNKDMPIITVFSPNEKTIDEIPFPAVTICNVNNVQKSKFNAVLKQATKAIAGFLTKEEADLVFAKLLDIYYICEGGDTFTEKFTKNHSTGMIEEGVKRFLFDNGKKHDFEKFVNPSKTLAESSQSCNDMILYCVWQGNVQNCSKLFSEVETDYGYCCTFNTIPISLLVRSDPREDPERIKEWRNEDLDYDKLLFTDETKDTRKQPLRQVYPGREAGLSVFLDPDLDEYHCTNTDSHGFVVTLNVPLDFPRIKDTGISIPNGSEVMINVRPQITMMDPTVVKFPLVSCKPISLGKELNSEMLGKEFKLPHYTKYTTSNCLDECIANKTKDECGCLRYYMPHSAKDKFCRPLDYKCVEKVRTNIYEEGLGKACGICLPTCTEIEYDAVSTQLLVQNERVEKLFNRSFMAEMGNHIFKRRDHHHPSIVHIYFGGDSTYPRLKTESASMTELISNAGGILGLCLGFSVLSLLEIVYYMTIRLGCNWYRDRSLESQTTAIQQYDNTAAMQIAKGMHMKGGSWILGNGGGGGMHNSGISVSDISKNQIRYNSLMDKWAV